MNNYKIVQCVDGVLVSICPTDIVEWARANNRSVEPLSERRKSVLRQELRDQPKIGGLSGPMYDGEINGRAVIRYEDQEAFDLLCR